MRATPLPALALALLLPAAAIAAGPHDPPVWEYAKKCFDRIGLVDHDDLKGPFVCKAPDAKRLVTQVDGHVKDIGICDPKHPSCASLPAGEKCCPDKNPPKCDYPAWLELSSQSCYGNSYVQEIKARSNPNIVGALLCRHKHSWSDGDDDFEDIAMIVHNRKNGETCWFQTDDFRGINLDGRKVPGPETVTDHSFWLRPIDTASVVCVKCHDNGPFMNSRWMANAIDLSDSEDEPYRSSEPPFDRWPVPRFVKSDKAKACQGCHKIAAGGLHEVALDPTRPAWKIHAEFQSCADCNKVCTTTPGDPCDACRGWIQRVTGQTLPASHPRGANAKALSDDIALWMPDLGTHTRADWDKDYKAEVDHLMQCCAEVGRTKPGTKPKLAGCSEFVPKVAPAIASAAGSGDEDIYAEIDAAHEKADEDIYAALDESFETRVAEPVATREASPDGATAVVLPLETQPLPPELAAAGAAALRSVKGTLGAFPKDERVDCFVEKLEQADADDRVIPWTRICPAKGPDAALCAASSVGEAAIAGIGSPEQVEAVNDAVAGRKFIVHLRSDLLRKDASLPPVVYTKPNQAIMVHHLKQLVRDVALADTKLAAGAPAPGYAGIKAWIDARKRDPRSVYACASVAAAASSSATPGCKWNSMDVIDPRIDDGAQQSLMRKLRLSSPPEVRAEGSAMLLAVKNESLAGILKPFRPAVTARAQKLGKTGDQLIPAGRDSTCVTEPAADRPLIVYRTGLDEGRIDRALSDAWKECGLETPLPPCDYEVVLKPGECSTDQECRDKELGWACVDHTCVQCSDSKHCEEQELWDRPLCNEETHTCVEFGLVVPPPLEPLPCPHFVDCSKEGLVCNDATGTCEPPDSDRIKCIMAADERRRAREARCEEGEAEAAGDCVVDIGKCTASTLAGSPDVEACAKAARCGVGGPYFDREDCKKAAFRQAEEEKKLCK